MLPRSAVIAIGLVFAGEFGTLGCRNSVPLAPRPTTRPLFQQSVEAGPIQQFHDHFTDGYSAEICGILTNVQVVETQNIFLFADNSFRVTISAKTTFTNPVNGKSVVTTLAGEISGTAPMVDEAARTITFLTSNKGLPEKIQTGNGPVLLRDAGIITFADKFDLDTGAFISEQIVANKGPHPEADSDFTLFCEVITPALT
jgi:hypothetical protein